MFKIKIISKLLLYSALLIFLPICAVLLLNHQTTRIVENLCMDNYISLLQETSNKMDENIRAIDKWTFDLMVNRSLSTVLNSASPRENSDSVYPMYQFIQNGMNYSDLSNDICMEFQIISQHNDLVYRHNSFVSDLKLYYESMVNYPKMDYSHWINSLYSQKKRTYLPTQPINIDSKTVEAVTYIVPINYGIHSQSGGIISFILNNGAIADAMSIANPDQAAEIFMFSEDNKLLFSTTEPENEHSGLTIPEPGLLNEARNSGASMGFFDMKSDNMMAYAISSYNDLMYIAVVPRQVILSQMYTVNNTTRNVMSIYIFFSIIFAFVITYRINKPLQNLIAGIAASIPAERSVDLSKTGEYQFIAENMNRLLQHNQLLELSEKNNAQTLAEIALDRLINGQAKANDSSLIMLEKLSLPADWDCCCVCVLKIPEFEPFYNKNHPIFDLADIIEREKESFSLKCYLRPLTSCTIALIFIYKKTNRDNDYSLIFSALKTVDIQIYQASGIHPYIGIGRQYDDIYDSHFSCEQALYAAEILMSDNSKQPYAPFIISYSDAVISKEMYYYPIDLECRLVNCVKSGEIEETASIIQKIIDENFVSRSIPTQMQRQLVYDIRSSLFKLCSEIGKQSYCADFSGELRKNEDILQYIQSIGEVLKTIAEECHKSKRSHNSQLKDRVLVYINQNYQDCQLGLGTIAREFNLSESYFSQFFRMQTGEPFSSYLENLRIGKAKFEIEQNQGIGIEKLCRLVGYSNSNTFRKAFKRVTGLSPSAYKQSCNQHKDT